MFSPTELISLVFANEDDIYYGDDLLKLNLNQYLWKELHKTYQTVYFLTAADKSFTVRTFGDVTGTPYVPRHGLFSSEQSKFSGWLLRQLRSKQQESAAFVCTLEDFCTVFAQPQWQETLQAIANDKKRSGGFILTASTTDETTSQLLLSSPVFQLLCDDGITGIRGGTVRSLYEGIQKSKWKSCFFLNAFTQERIQSLLLHIVMEFPDRCVSLQELSQMADYLTVYLRTPKLNRSQPIFPKSLPIHYLLYRDLYEQLKNEKIWKRLERHSVEYARITGRSQTHDWEGPEIPILRDPNCYAGKCLLLRLPKWMLSDRADADTAEQILSDIQRQAVSPRNRPENPSIIAEIQKFLQLLEIIHHGDVGSYLQVLDAIKFCMEWLYIEDNTEKFLKIMSIIKQMHDTLTVCEQCFKLSFNLQLQHPQEGDLLQTKTVSQLKEQLGICLGLRDRSLDLIRASVMGLSMPTGDTGIARQVEQLQEKIQQFGSQIPDTVPVPEPTKSEPEPEEEDPSEFVLTREDYDFIPSVSW